MIMILFFSNAQRETALMHGAIIISKKYGPVGQFVLPKAA